MDDDVSIDELRQAVEHLHGVPAKFIEAVEVDERFNGEVVWQGTVNVFDVTGSPQRRHEGLRLELQDRGHAPEVQGRAGRAALGRAGDGGARHPRRTGASSRDVDYLP